MNQRVKYCSQCGHEVVVRTEAGREREVCPSCGTVYYLNPVPVAAAAVLDHGRRLLLVKRGLQPQQGMWCLPIGFAEVEESIRQAALRELREEAGIEGEVRALLDADSYPSVHYGDLLIMSFEVTKTGGVETAGDDAEEVGYFPLEDLPPLAFRSNERAVAALVARHRDEWRIQDSFARFRYGDEEAVLSDPLVLIVEQHQEEIAGRWVEQIVTHPTTATSHTFPRELLRAQAAEILSLLTGRLRGRGRVGELVSSLRALGEERARTGVPLHEALSSLSLLKLTLWSFAREAGAWETPLDVYRVLELSFLVNSFFDRAAYHLARGYASVTPA